ncbi:hypothetical protein PAB09_09325 [Corynebacterium sp. SCR221107]|uniref:hypothetical protein n=1 Tax=Corynebacterium sp. SCR221107 TaxID=3017361 RepID=UPI0022EC1D28|nr:hypothetical protein [Corynebacterium sp. SCR221107]WBT08095.1 hypothetical protein PAB09_09325 [Corynebacterium sp. SCR221107]
MPGTKKTPVDAATSNEGNTTQKKENVMQPVSLHLIDHRNSTGESFVMKDGSRMPRRSRVFALSDEDVARAAAGQITVTICEDCREIERTRRMREEEKQRRMQEEREWEDTKDRIAREVTMGQVYGALDLKTQLIAAKRDGRDYSRLVDAMVAIDQAELARHGLTTWSDDDSTDVEAELFDELARVISRGQVAGADSLDGDLARYLDDVAGLVNNMSFEEGTRLLVSRIEKERAVWARERGGQA